jgi:hypothetical protein
VCPHTYRASETSHRLSATPVYLRKEARASQVTRPSSSDVLWSNTPPATPPPRPSVAGERCGLRVFQHAWHPESRGFEAATPRPARLPAYASPMALRPPSQGWLPTRAGSPLAGRVLHPLDDTQNFMKTSHPPSPIDPRGLVALFYLSSSSRPSLPLAGFTAS